MLARQWSSFHGECTSVHLSPLLPSHLPNVIYAAGALVQAFCMYTDSIHTLSPPPGWLGRRLYKSDIDTYGSLCAVCTSYGTLDALGLGRTFFLKKYLKWDSPHHYSITVRISHLQEFWFVMCCSTVSFCTLLSFKKVQAGCSFYHKSTCGRVPLSTACNYELIRILLLYIVNCCKTPGNVLFGFLRFLPYTSICLFF